MSRRRRGRDIHGLLLLDKPQGLSSNQALQRARRLFDARKGGHTGSLDPLATGVLPLCFGHATRVSAFLLDADKRYRVIMRLGQRTDSADADGQLVDEAPIPPTTDADLQSAAANLTGAIEQVPPMYSALKRDGQRLYQLARQGIEVERPPRPVTIYAIDDLRRIDDDLHFDVHCSKGTYVRSLVEDLAAALGTLGHVTLLRRLQVGSLRPSADAPLWTLEQLEARLADDGPAALDACLLPTDWPLRDWPAATLDANAASAITQGQAVFHPLGRELPPATRLRLYGPAAELLALAVVADDGRLAPQRVFAAAAD